MPTATLDLANALDLYKSWSRPTAIIVDGPYGVGGFPGDPPTTDDLARWYIPHATGWAERATPQTTLWFWGTELSWATVHPALDLAGWDYRTAHVWNKGLAHIAGNVNGNTIRRFPIATEVCVQYVRRVELETGEGELLPIKEWLRAEWLRTGLPLSATNQAAGVKNAATRKYFTRCHLWYSPPPDVMERIASFAIKHGRPTERPYFSMDGATELSADQWAATRSKWNHEHGVTNVWSAPPVHGAERVKNADGRYVHANQKPLDLMELIIRASTDRRDAVWDPFAGLATVGVAAARLGRRYFGAEIAPRTYDAATARLAAEGVTVKTVAQRDSRREQSRNRSAQRARGTHQREPGVKAPRYA